MTKRAEAHRGPPGRLTEAPEPPEGALPRARSAPRRPGKPGSPRRLHGGKVAPGHRSGLQAGPSLRSRQGREAGAPQTQPGPSTWERRSSAERSSRGGGSGSAGGSPRPAAGAGFEPVCLVLGGSGATEPHTRVSREAVKYTARKTFALPEPSGVCLAG